VHGNIKMCLHLFIAFYCAFCFYFLHSALLIGFVIIFVLLILNLNLFLFPTYSEFVKHHNTTIQYITSAHFEHYYKKMDSNDSRNGRRKRKSIVSQNISNSMMKSLG